MSAVMGRQVFCPFGIRNGEAGERRREVASSFVEDELRHGIVVRQRAGQPAGCSPIF